MDSEVFSTERYVNSSQVTVSFGVLNDDWCLIQQRLGVTVVSG